ncbi:MAG: hypothetical protein AAGE80_04835 [Pseudomonadota bacterium]
MQSSLIRRLILVVHGVGRQIPGETVGMVAACLKTAPGTQVSSAQLMMLEDEPPRPNERPPMFPAHVIHRKTPTADELFAEVYWADVAKTSHKFLGILLQLFQVILGLGHLVRESADQTYSRGSLPHFLANAGVWILHGPIAALNAVVLLLCFASMAMEIGGYTYIVDGEATRHRWTIAFGVALVALSITLFFRTRRYLMRHFFLWVLIGALVTIALSIIHQRDETTGGGLTIWTFDLPQEQVPIIGREESVPASQPVEFDVTSQHVGFWIEQRICGWARKTDPETCVKELGGVYSVAAALVVLQWLFWLALLWCTCLLLLCHLIRWSRFRDHEKLKPVPGLAPVALSGMMITWLFALSCIWAVTIFLYPDFGGHKALFVSAFHPVYVNWLILLLAGAFAVWLTGVQLPRYARRAQERPYFHETGLHLPPRMILANPIALTMMIGPFLLFAVMVVLTLLSVDGSSVDSETVREIDALSRYYLDELFISVVFLGGLLYLMRDELAVGLGIANDIINYMRIEEWEPDPAKRRYPLRERIEQRFVTVAREMIARHNPTEVIVVAHSQGTVIALDALRTDDQKRVGAKGELRALCGQDQQWRLVTLGSPFTHLYGEYFPRDFKIPRPEDVCFSEWTNIFRIDDFIGTHICHRARWPTEVPIGPGGHTWYWVEDTVKDILQKQIAPEAVAEMSLPTGAAAE